MSSLVLRLARVNLVRLYGKRNGLLVFPDSWNKLFMVLR